jgi:hypothetical protein
MASTAGCSTIFHGLNPIASQVANVGRRGGHLATRRWYYLIAASGEPRGLVHAIESHTLEHLPGRTERYAGRGQLESGLRHLLAGMRRVAMSISPGNAIPLHLPRWTPARSNWCGGSAWKVVSSGDLIQRFSRIWTRARCRPTALPREAVPVKDRAFESIAQRTAIERRSNEYDIQQMMVAWFREEGSSAIRPRTSRLNPTPEIRTTSSTAETARRSGRTSSSCSICGPTDRPGACLLNHLVGFTGRRPKEKHVRAFDAVRWARDAAAESRSAGPRRGQARDVRGWDVDRGRFDRAARRPVTGEQILHRTGHSLGEESARHLAFTWDDYETHDDRRLLPGTRFHDRSRASTFPTTIGVRSEIKCD